MLLSFSVKPDTDYRRVASIAGVSIFKIYIFLCNLSYFTKYHSTERSFQHTIFIQQLRIYPRCKIKKKLNQKFNFWYFWIVCIEVDLFKSIDVTYLPVNIAALCDLLKETSTIFLFGKAIGTKVIFSTTPSTRYNTDRPLSILQ